MDALTTDGTRDHLHGVFGIVAPSSNIDRGESQVSSSEQCRMPAEQLLARDRPVAIGGGVELAAIKWPRPIPCVIN